MDNRGDDQIRQNDPSVMGGYTTSGSYFKLEKG